MNPLPHSLWDLAGVDGLQTAKALFGDSIDRIAPFQSIDTTLADQPCAVLRLCEANFRIAWPHSAADFQQQAQAAQAGRRVWVKQLPWLGAIALPESSGDRLRAIAIPKPPHRLQLPMHSAAIARIDGIAVLIWRHSIANQPAFELHSATKDLERLQAKFTADQRVFEQGSTVPFSSN